MAGKVGRPKGYSPPPKFFGWGLTEAQKKEVDATRALYKNNFELFCKNELKIIDRESPTGSGIRNFEWNEAQRRLHRTIELVRLHNLRRSKELNAKDPSVPISDFPIQLVILKPRKVGISTFLQARALWRCEFEQNIEALIMAHEYNAARNIASIAKRYLDLWTPLKTDYRKAIHKHTDKAIAWGKDPSTDQEWGSKIVVTTAGRTARGTNRGFTFHYVHISEEAHFQSESEVSAALAATVPYKETYEESTANGIGGMFYDNFINAANIESVMNGHTPDNWNGKFRYFFGWFEDPNYRKAVTPEEEAHIKRTLSPREEQLIDQFKCDMEQLAWRRYKIGSECTAQSEMSPEDYFNQEYPTEYEDAFVTTGSNAFSLRPLVDMRGRNSKNPDLHFSGHLSVIEGPDHCTRMSTNHEPTCVLLKPPVMGAQYVMGVDTCVGLQHGDNSVISIWWRKSMDYIEEVGRVINKAPADELAKMAVYLAELYNDAFIVPESNPPGNATCLYIHKLGYPHMYMRENPEKIGETDDNNSFLYGFYTNQRTKPLLISAGQEAVRSRRVWIRSKTALHQWQIYKNADGRYMAPEGEKDDCVMADCLAIWAHFTHHAPLVRKLDDPSKESYDPSNEANREISAEIRESWEKIRKLKKHHANLREKRRVLNANAILGRYGL